MRLYPTLCAVALVTACGTSSNTPPGTAPDASPDVTVDAQAVDAAPDMAATPDVTAMPDTATAQDAPTEPDVPPAVAAMIAARPYGSRVPSAYTAERAWPLVVLLHGYGATGAAQSVYLGFSLAYERRGFLLATPDGTVDAINRRFWNATDACCDFAHANIDDVAYVSAVIDDMSARYRVDPRRVYIVGHSNGAFMANRMACERANRVAAIVSLAGAVWNDPARCTPSTSVSVLQVHGTVDDTIMYGGGMVAASGAGRYPGARATVATWAMLNRCASTFTDTMMRRDFVTNVDGAETVIGRHESCMGGAAELWTMEGVGHIPAFSSMWSDAVFDWLMAHPKPAP